MNEISFKRLKSTYALLKQEMHGLIFFTSLIQFIFLSYKYLLKSLFQLVIYFSFYACNMLTLAFWSLFAVIKML